MFFAIEPQTQYFKGAGVLAVHTTLVANCDWL